MSPGPLPDPPADYALLADFPTVPKEEIPDGLYRIHQTAHDPEWYGTGGDGRWDPPSAAAGLFGSCYLATDPITAIVEALGDLPLITEETIDRRSMAHAGIPRTLRVADMTSPAMVGG